MILASESMRPEHGGRIVLRRIEVRAEQARYAFEASTKDCAWSGQAEVDRTDGTVRFAAWQEDAAPEWLCDLAKSVLRVAWRNSESGRWPQRLARWRSEPTS